MNKTKPGIEIVRASLPGITWSPYPRYIRKIMKVLSAGDFLLRAGTKEKDLASLYILKYQLSILVEKVGLGLTQSETEQVDWNHPKHALAEVIINAAFRPFR